MLYVPDSKKIHAEKTMAELQAPYSMPFVAMAQAHLPNPKHQPIADNQRRK